MNLVVFNLTFTNFVTVISTNFFFSAHGNFFWGVKTRLAQICMEITTLDSLLTGL